MRKAGTLRPRVLSNAGAGSMDLLKSDVGSSASEDEVNDVGREVDRATSGWVASSFCGFSVECIYGNSRHAGRTLCVVGLCDG